jgi:hypothetical protein
MSDRAKTTTMPVMTDRNSEERIFPLNLGNNLFIGDKVRLRRKAVLQIPSAMQ